MSVTVLDAMNLPSLRSATVIAGKAGLGKIVSGISVLELADPDRLIADVFLSGEYLASELVITGFLNNTTDIELQCAILRKLAEGGEVGLILFYVGSYMPQVDRRLMDLADELAFPLIQMPNNMSLRYGAVISDVTECLYRDREKSASIVSDILARIAGLSQQHRTVNVVLKMLSERLQATVVLTDLTFQIINLASWPGGTEESVKQSTEILRKAAEVKEMIPHPIIPEGFINHALISPVSSPAMWLFAIKQGEALDRGQMEQAADVVRIGVNIWGQQHGAIVLSELIRAIIQDDPIKMRRLADIFHVNIADIHDIWVLYGYGDTCHDTLKRHQKSLCEALQSCSEHVFADFYDDRLFLLSSDPDSRRTAETRLMQVLGQMQRADPSITLFSSGNLQTTSDVRAAYLCYKTYLEDAKRIYPAKSWFSLGELEFAENCHHLIDQGEETLHQVFRRLETLREKELDWDALETLGVFMLDTACSVSGSAEQLHVHQNTIKYRINVVANILGFRPGKMPDSMELYQALAVHRLLEKS